MGVKPDKKLKRFILFAAGIVILLFLSTFFFQNILSKSELLRGKFEDLEYLKKEKTPFGPFVVEKKDSTLSVVRMPGKYRKGFTIIGTAVVNKKSRDAVHSIKLIQHPDGKFIVDFHYFFPPLSDKKSNLFLEIESKRGLERVKLNKSRDLTRYQALVDLSKNDTVRFSLEGKGVVLLGDPVFYREDEYEGKTLVFVISADTLRYDHVGVYNLKKKCTPSIDTFSRDAVIFRNAYSTSSWTLPAHVSLFTGLFAHAHAVNLTENKKNGKMGTTLFEPLQKKFITVGFSGNLFLSHYFGFSRGFDYYSEAGHDTSNRNASKFLFEKTMKYISDDEYNAPLLFFLHTYQIHSLFYPGKEVVKKFYEKEDLKYECFDIMEFTKYGKEQFIKGVPEKEKNEIIKMYDAGIRTFDYRFGKFIKFLKTKKLYDRSLIILFSDHGEEFGEHGGWAHGHSLYNELIKIPLIVKFPGNKQAGLEVNHVVSIVDIMPTVLALNRIKDESGKSQGIPLTAVIKSKTGNRKVFSYLAAHARFKTARKTAVISNRFKLIYNKKMSPADLEFFLSLPPLTSQYELFDLEEDPFELINRIKENKFEFYQLSKILKNLKYKKPGEASKNELEKELKSLGYIQ